MKLKPLLAIAIAAALTGCNDSDDVTTNANGLSTINQTSLESLAASDTGLDIQYKLIDNNPAQCPEAAPWGLCFESEITLMPKSDADVMGWELYFSSIQPVLSVDSSEFNLERINGDLHKITPKEAFTGFKANEAKTIRFFANYWHLQETDIMPNYYITADGLAAKTIASTQVTYNSATGLEELPYVTPLTDIDKHFKRTPSDQTVPATASVLFDRNVVNALATDTDVSDAIIPTPSSVVKGSGMLDLSSGVKFPDNADMHIQTAMARLAPLGIQRAANGVPVSIQVQTDSSKAAGSYTLDIQDDQIQITGVDQAGAFYGLQSLVSLIEKDKKMIPVMTVTDGPRFSYRGLHLDVARNFHSKALVMKLLDQMAAYKLNKLHLHLADDEGWRLEIDGLPELTDIGSKRCHDLTETSCLLPQLGSGPDASSAVNGYFSIADYIDIVTAANARHIQVIPSLDMPGHARAAVKAMEARYKRYTAENNETMAREYLLSEAENTSVYSSVQYYNDNTINPCLDSSYTFIDKVIAEVKSMHESASQPLSLYHIGADENANAWDNSPACQTLIDKGTVASTEKLGAYFIEKVARHLTLADVASGGWSDGFGHTDPAKMPATNVQSNAWGTLFWGGSGAAHTHANLGWDVIVSTPDATYFDFPYEADPKERGYYWASRHTNTRKVFNFMPENLPAMAEVYKGRQEDTFSDDDATPLHSGNKAKGIQGHLWSETIRTDEQVEYMAFPRLIALAERAWHQADWEIDYVPGTTYASDDITDADGNVTQAKTHFFTANLASRDTAWANFAYVLSAKELPKLDQAGIQYRLPTIGAKVVNGSLEVNSIFPTLGIQYQTAEGSWMDYDTDAKPTTAAAVRAVAPNGERYGRSIAVQ